MRAPQPGDLALTVHQPWADLIVSGAKDVENRTWPVPSTLPFPFRLWIHAGLTIDSNPDAHRKWAEGAFPRLRLEVGVLLGSVTVTGCHHADECRRVVDNPQEVVVGRDVYVSDFGRVLRCSAWAEPGVHHWQVASALPLERPVPMRGRQRLWRVTADDR